jgi:hypothetical protein
MSVIDLLVILVVVAGYVASVYIVVVFIGNKRLQRIEHRLEYLINRMVYLDDSVRQAGGFESVQVRVEEPSGQSRES